MDGRARTVDNLSQAATLLRTSLSVGRNNMTRIRIAGALALGALTALLLGSSASAGDLPALSGASDESPAGWLVELTGTVDGFRREAKEAGVKLAERRSFSTLWNGVSVEAAPGDVSTLRSLPGVAAVYPNVVASVPPAAFAASASPASDARDPLPGVDGAGVTVGLIDSGVDWQHPDLGGCFGPGCHVASGWDFVGDAYDPNPASPTYSPTPVPDSDPDDCNGHGTHVAGIVAANGRVRGVAPGATLAAYRVMGCAGQVAADVLLAAMERALRDGVDVLNISIATPFVSWPEYPPAKAASRLVDRGVVVVAAIGNNGPAPTYSAGAPAVGEKVIGVASFDSVRSELAAFTVSPDGRKVLYTPATGAPPAPTVGGGPLSFLGSGCAPQPSGSLSGRIALVVRGVCTLHTKAVVAQAAGASGVVLVNNVAGRFTPIVTGPVPVTIPFVGVTLADGSLLAARLESGPVTLTWTDSTGTEPVATGGSVSAFSSCGLAADLSLKPDLGAPGGFVWSTYPLEKGRYTNVSGTSMASPQVAGAAALLLQARPGTRAEDVRTVFQNTADPRPVLGTSLLDAVHRQGAGLLDLEGALSADSLVTPGRLALGEGFGGTARLTIANESDHARTYTLSQLPAVATSRNTPAYTFTAFADRPATVTFASASLTVPARRSTSVAVSIAPDPTLPDLSTYGGYLVVDDGEGGRYTVPYAGLKGDYQALPILTGLRFLVRATASGPVPVTADGAVFRLTGPAELPTVLLHLDQQAERLEARVVRASDGSPLHPVFSTALEVEHLPKSATPGGFITFEWGGTRLHSNGGKEPTRPVPDGSYRLVVRLLRSLGDPSNPAHWDVFTTPAFTIDRP